MLCELTVHIYPLTFFSYSSVHRLQGEVLFFLCARSWLARIVIGKAPKQPKNDGYKDPHEEDRKMRSRTKYSRWAFIIAATAGLYVCFGLISLPVMAQTGPTSFQLQQFRPWGEPEGGLQTLRADSLGQWNYLISFHVNYAKDPLILRNRSENRIADVVRHQVGADVGLALGLLDFLDLQLRLPVTLFQDSVSPEDAGFSSAVTISGVFFSDVQLGVRLQLLRQKNHFLSMAVQSYIGFPTNLAGSLNGEESVSAGVMLLLSKRLSIIDVSLNVGYHYGPKSTLSTLVFEHSLVYSFAISAEVVRDRLVLIADLAGRASPGGESASMPLEIYVGARFFPLKKRTLALTLGGAAGLIYGVGAPIFRVLAGISWSPGAPGRKNQMIDTDGDGVLDTDDLCPRTAGPKNNKGCPWVDSDGDTLKDNVDKCPQAPGPVANKGCPWIDTDGDGLHDGIDKCPTLAGPTHRKGCPILDRDRDGILDVADQCPDVPGLKSLKGCPKIILVNVTGSRINILQKIHFTTASAIIRPISFPILAQVISVLLAQPQLKIRIEGHTDNRGGSDYNLKLSRARARSVFEYFKLHGVAATRLQSVGLGLSQPRATNATKVGRQINRRVEFHIIK